MFTYETIEPLNYGILDCSELLTCLKISISVLPKNILFLYNTDGESSKIHHISNFLCTLLNHQMLNCVSSDITLGDNEINTKLIQERGGM